MARGSHLNRTTRSHNYEIANVISVHCVGGYQPLALALPDVACDLLIVDHRAFVSMLLLDVRTQHSQIVRSLATRIDWLAQFW